MGQLAFFITSKPILMHFKFCNPIALAEACIWSFKKFTCELNKQYQHLCITPYNLLLHYITKIHAGHANFLAVQDIADAVYYMLLTT